MNYIYELNAFFDWLETNVLSTSAANLWHSLMHINNKAGWKKEFTVSRSLIEAKTGLRKDAYYRGRKLLQEKGRIGFREQGSQATMFWIIPFSNEDEKTFSAKSQEKRQVSKPAIEKKQTVNQTTNQILANNQSDIHTYNQTTNPISNNIRTTNQTTDVNQIENPTINQEISQTIIPTTNEIPTTSQTINQTTTQTILKQNKTKQMNDDNYIRVKECYEQSFGMITPFFMEELEKWVQELDSTIVIEAIQRAVEKNKPWVYAKKILINWSNQKVRSLQDVQTLDLQHTNQPNNQPMYLPFTKDELMF